MDRKHSYQDLRPTGEHLSKVPATTSLHRQAFSRGRSRLLATSTMEVADLPELQSSNSAVRGGHNIPGTVLQRRLPLQPLTSSVMGSRKTPPSPVLTSAGVETNFTPPSPVLQYQPPVPTSTSSIVRNRTTPPSPVLQNLPTVQTSTSSVTGSSKTPPSPVLTCAVVPRSKTPTSPVLENCPLVHALSAAVGVGNRVSSKISSSVLQQPPVPTSTSVVEVVRKTSPRSWTRPPAVETPKSPKLHTYVLRKLDIAKQKESENSSEHGQSTSQGVPLERPPVPTSTSVVGVVWKTPPRSWTRPPIVETPKSPKLHTCVLRMLDDLAKQKESENSSEHVQSTSQRVPLAIAPVCTNVAKPLVTPLQSRSYFQMKKPAASSSSHSQKGAQRLRYGLFGPRPANGLEMLYKKLQKENRLHLPYLIDAVDEKPESDSEEDPNNHVIHSYLPLEHAGMPINEESTGASTTYPQPIKREHPRLPLVVISEPQWVPSSAAVAVVKPLLVQAQKRTADASQLGSSNVASNIATPRDAIELAPQTSLPAPPLQPVETPRNSSTHVASGVVINKINKPKKSVRSRLQPREKIPENVLQKESKPETEQKSLTQATDSKHECQTLSMNGKTYLVLGLLGTGGSSKVYQVFDRDESKLYAMKVVDLAQADILLQTSYRNEIELLLKLQGSDLVIKMHGYEHQLDSKRLLILLEKGETDLGSLLKNITKSKPLHPIHIKSYWLEMLMAVAEIHKAGVIHSDLKPANFLFISGQLKLIDFGIANALQEDMTSVFKESLMGTCNYMAPEVLQSTPCNTGEKRYKVKPKSDVWSLGCILYNMVYGHTPFHHITNMISKLHAIANTSYQIIFPHVSDPQLLDVLKICLNRDPNLRPSIEDLIRHPYLLAGNAAIISSMDINAICTHLQKILTPRRMKVVSQVLSTVK